MNLLISSCLLGVACRYDGKSVPQPFIEVLNQKFTLIPVCAEVFGGLPTPRTPSERREDAVMTHDGRNVTDAFAAGAEMILRIALETGTTLALLKERSPSCGHGMIYDGTFSGSLISGNGVCAELLEKHGIRIFGESEIESLLQLGIEV